MEDFFQKLSGQILPSGPLIVTSKSFTLGVCNAFVRGKIPEEKSQPRWFDLNIGNEN